MNKKLENSQFQIATASTLKAISGDLESEREIKFSGSSGYLSSKRPGDQVEVKYVRDANIKTAKVTLKKSSN